MSKPSTTKYTKVKVNISEGQKAKIMKAMENGSKTVTIRLAYEDLIGEDVMALTRKQVLDMVDGLQNGQSVTIVLTKPQIKYNTEIEGGFLGALLPFLATAGKFLLSSALPALATGALAGVGTTLGAKAVNKVTGSACDDMNTVYVRKGGVPFKMTRMGKGLYLSPWGGNGVSGDGLFLSSGGMLYDGSALVYGEDSKFRKVPFMSVLL